MSVFVQELPPTEPEQTKDQRPLTAQIIGRAWIFLGYVTTLAELFISGLELCF